MAVAISENKLSLHEFIGLVEQYPDRKFKLNAAGDAVEMSPSRSHGFLQGWIWGIAPGLVEHRRLAWLRGWHGDHA